MNGCLVRYLVTISITLLSSCIFFVVFFSFLRFILAWLQSCLRPLCDNLELLDNSWHLNVVRYQISDDSIHRSRSCSVLSCRLICLQVDPSAQMQMLNASTLNTHHKLDQLTLHPGIFTLKKVFAVLLAISNCYALNANNWRGSCRRASDCRAAIAFLCVRGVVLSLVCDLVLKSHGVCSIKETHLLGFPECSLDILNLYLTKSEGDFPNATYMCISLLNTD